MAKPSGKWLKFSLEGIVRETGQRRGKGLIGADASITVTNGEPVVVPWSPGSSVAPRTKSREGGWED